jgi:type I restriction enzyme, S subunit
MSAIIDYRGKTPRKTSIGIPLITAKIVKRGRIEPAGEFIDPDEYDAWMRRGIPKVGDVLLTTEAPLGEVAQLTDDRIALAQRLILLRGKPDVLDNTYLKFLLASEPIQSQLRGRASGTTVVGIKQSELRKVTLPLPPINEQRAIAGVLGALDEKIEQNRRTAEALERLAQAIFRAWFVDFEPVKAKAAGATAFPSMPQPVFDALPTRFVDSAIGPVPEGWAVLRLDEILTLQRGFDLPKQARIDGPIPILAASGVNGWHSDWKVKGPGVTTGRSGILGHVFFVEHDFWPLNTSLWVKNYKRSNPWHAYFLLQTLELAQLNAGSAVPTLNRNHVHSLPIVAPPDSLLDSFRQTSSVTFSLEQQLRSESDKLAELRDYLLPRLLSGSVRVKDAEQALEATA